MEQIIRDENGKERKQTLECCMLQLALDEYCASSFNFEKAVCNHGFFMMAPNHWTPSTKTLQRPLRLADATSSVNVSISHPHNSTSILIKVHAVVDDLSLADTQAILAQVARMLRISLKDERDVQSFQKVHPEAKQRGFGRMFRSPSIFEDAVKSLLLCNCTWAKTLKMSEDLCKLQLELTNNQKKNSHHRGVMNGEERSNSSSIKAIGKKGLKRKYWATKKANSIKAIGKKGLKKKYWATKKANEVNKLAGSSSAVLVVLDDQLSNTTRSSSTSKSLGNFPTPKELASLNEEILKQHCSSLGYRAAHILKFARSFESGRLKLREFEEKEDPASYEHLYGKLKKVKGFGPFACATVMMCVGYYEKVPEDTETIRHLSQTHAGKICNSKTVGAIVKEIYGKYAPFQCLAYWLELLDDYENQFGRLSELPNSLYGVVTGSLVL